MAASLVGGASGYAGRELCALVARHPRLELAFATANEQRGQRVRAGGREITLGDLAKDGMLGGINAVIVGNYLTTLGRSATDDLAMLADLAMPVKALSQTL